MPHHLDAQLGLAPIVEEKGLGATLAFVVTGSRPDRIDVAPIFLRLRMDVGIAIDLRRRGLQNLGAQPLGEAEHVDGTVHTGLRRLHRIVLVVNGRGRASKIVDLVDLDIERERHVVAHQLEALTIEEMGDVALGASEEVVDADDIAAALQQALAQMRAEKSGPARDEDASLEVHSMIDLVDG
jgi:hypothetical protein